MIERLQILPLLVVAAGLSAGCAALPEARVPVPVELQAVAPERIEGLGASRTGTLTLSGLSGRYERSADRLSFFDLVSRDRAGVSLTTQDAQGRSTTMGCRGAQSEVSAGVITASARPWRYSCTASGALQGELTLQGRRAEAGTRDERQGTWTAPGMRLELRSLHLWEGAALPVPQPVGYVVLDAGRPVGLLELNGPAPRLWRPAADSPLRPHVTQALLALALVWDPA